MIFLIKFGILNSIYLETCSTGSFLRILQSFSIRLSMKQVTPLLTMPRFLTKRQIEILDPEQ